MVATSAAPKPSAESDIDISSNGKTIHSDECPTRHVFETLPVAEQNPPSVMGSLYADPSLHALVTEAVITTDEWERALEKNN